MDIRVNDICTLIVYACIIIDHECSVPLKIHEPLYDGAVINMDTSWAAIMQYAVKHNLTYAALQDLISLIKVIN